MSPMPLFVCYANCCRSVLAEYLYQHLFPTDGALSAGIQAGEKINDRACAMLDHWGIDARQHMPRQLDSQLCGQADAIFLMGPEYLHRLLDRFGEGLASKSYLFADPFALPRSFADGAYLVFDPSFENRLTVELANEFRWFWERIAQIHDALLWAPHTLIPATRYLDVLVRYWETPNTGGSARQRT